MQQAPRAITTATQTQTDAQPNSREMVRMLFDKYPFSNLFQDEVRHMNEIWARAWDPRIRQGKLTLHLVADLAEFVPYVHGSITSLINQAIAIEDKASSVLSSPKSAKKEVKMVHSLAGDDYKVVIYGPVNYLDCLHFHMQKLPFTVMSSTLNDLSL